MWCWKQQAVFTVPTASCSPIAGEGPEKARLQLEYGHLPNVMFPASNPKNVSGEFPNLADLHILPQTADAEDLVLPSKLGGMLASGKPCLVMAGPGSELAEFVADAALFGSPLANRNGWPRKSDASSRARLYSMRNVRSA